LSVHVVDLPLFVEQMTKPVTMKNQVRKQKTKKGDVPKVKTRQKICIRCNENFKTDYPNGHEKTFFCGDCIHQWNAEQASKAKKDVARIAKKLL